MRQLTHYLLVIGIAVLGARAQSNPGANLLGVDMPGGSHAATDLRLQGPSQGGWLFPVTRLNETLPPWIQFGGQFRDRVEGQEGIRFAATDDFYNLTQLRLGVYIQPTDWFKVVAVTQDSRVFFNQNVPNLPPYQNIWDIREAYAQIGSSSHGWLDLIAGRQILSFGDERVIGPSDWSNVGRTFDSVRLDFHHPGMKMSIFAASAVNVLDGSIDHHIQGNNLYGIYGSFTHVIPRATFEPYFLWRVVPANVSLPENGGLGHLNEVTGGVRIAGMLHRNLDYDIEMNKQTGSLGVHSIDAWAGHWNGGYTFERARFRPRLFVEYNYASGNKNPSGRTWGTHDQIYPSAHNKIDLADQFGWKNIEDLRAGVSESFGRKWKLTEISSNLWLATKNDAVYNTAGAMAVPANPRATSNHLGTELGVIADYKPNRHITFGFGFAHLFTGLFLNESTRGKDYNYPFAYSTYVF